jgi:hypothetical protein
MIASSSVLERVGAVGQGNRVVHFPVSFLID